MINLLDTPPWTPGQIRSLVVRQLLCAFVTIVVATGGVVWARDYFKSLTPENVPADGLSAEVVSRCRSELAALEGFHLWRNESDRSRNQPRQALDIVESALPSEAWVTELIVSEARIDITGLSRSESAVSNFVEAVAVSGTVHELRLDSSHMALYGLNDVREFHMSGDMSMQEQGRHD
jgi:hypothetical protein